jgi:hypothetical protein
MEASSRRPVDRLPLEPELGLPGDQPDVGNWLCTLGMASLYVEASVIALSATRPGLRRPWRKAT